MGGGGGTLKGRDALFCELEYMVGGGGRPFLVLGRFVSNVAGEPGGGARVAVEARGRRFGTLEAKLADRYGGGSVVGGLW